MFKKAIARQKALAFRIVRLRNIFRRKVEAPLGQPVKAFGAALLLLIGGAAFALLYEDQHALRAKAERDAASFAHVAELSAAGKLDGLTEQLRLFRWLEASENYAVNWPKLLSEPGFIAIDEAEVSVTDKAGMIVASSHAVSSSKLVDVSDRPSFQIQAQATMDTLYVGPAKTAHDGKRKIFVSAKRLDREGAFAGVFIFAFPADYFMRQLAGLDLGADGGIALIGADGLIRSGAGVFKGHSGQQIGEVRQLYGGDVTSQKQIGGWPLYVVARLSDVESDAAWRNRRAFILFGAALAGMLIVAATWLIARRRKEFESEIFHLSRHDSLTGLPNRHSLSRELDRLCAAGGVKFALHVLDLDRFKLVNDTYGHVVGDELLGLVSSRLRGLMRADDLVARLGGDEFAVLQKVKHFEADAMLLAGRITAAMAEPFPTSRLTLSIGATVGVACGLRDGDTAVELMKAADLALYAAKADGRGRARAYHPALSETTTALVEMETGLRAALCKGELYLDYQPIHGLRNAGLIGYEALMRWRRSDGTLVRPDAFIPVAENLGLILDMGAWALRQACSDIANLPGDLEVAVNVSAAQFDAGRLVADVNMALRVSRLPAKRLRIEITESALLRDKPVVAEQIRALREMGVGVSLDDFGAGYSCLSYLEMYPIDTLKIDQGFVRKLGARPEAAATLRAIIDLARSYGMKTVGEGVETDEQYRALRELGCERAQGYLLGRPGPLPRSPLSSLGSAA